MPPLLLSRNVGASREVLWHHLSTARGLSSWQADSVEGGLEQGGFSMRWPQLGARLDLKVVEFEPGKRLVLETGDTLLELEVGEGRISLAHHGLQSDDDLEGLESSWRTALALLQVAATRHPEAQRHVHWIFAPVSGPAELAHHYFTHPSGLSSWLGDSSAELITGRHFELSISSEQRLCGEVLCGERDVCLRVEELGDGALALRTLPGPDGRRMAALGISSWHSKPEPRFITLFESALTRLSRIMQPGAS